MIEVIYALVDPRDNLEFYVGKTQDVYWRFFQHLRCKDNNKAKHDRIQEIKDLHLMPVLKTLEIIKDDAALASEREAYWIRHFKYLGRPLTNGIVYESKPSAKKASETLPLRNKNEEFLEMYPKVQKEWIAKNRRTATLREIIEVTGQSRRRLNKVPFRRSPRNPELILISSVIEWLKNAPPA